MVFLTFTTDQFSVYLLLSLLKHRGVYDSVDITLC